MKIVAKEIQFRVDDGIGFDLHAEHEGFGLLGMKERVDQMGGDLAQICFVLILVAGNAHAVDFGRAGRPGCGKTGRE